MNLFFAKNLDREPGERQIIQAVPGESLSLKVVEEIANNNSKPNYIETNFINLKNYLKTYLEAKESELRKGTFLDAVISRPE